MSMHNNKHDVLIVGAGIVGLTIAKRLLNIGIKSIGVLEKEKTIGVHSSGNNSGVLHAGVYYPENTLKAKFCLEGNRLMRAYCEEHGLPLNNSGKVIVAKDQGQLEGLDLIYKRAKNNGANIKYINQGELKEIEPFARTFEKALFVSDTCVVDPKKVINFLYKELLDSKKVKFYFENEFLGVDKDTCQVRTRNESLSYGYFINCAGSYADKVAKHFGLAENLSLIPFKGIYKKLVSSKAHLVNGNIYPVPNLQNPFLGVHFTKNIHGDVYVGPTAIPAFGRENYGLIKGIDKEAFKIALQNSILFFKNKKFRHVALSEPKKYSKHAFFNDSKKLVLGLEKSWLEKTNKVGIRPQLVDWDKKELVMDFMVESQGNSLHVLNAISPAFTSSLAFSDYIVSKYFS